MRRASGKDVANSSGYSLSTVMKVLGGTAGRYQISDTAVERISSVAARLGYQRSVSASTLRLGVSPTIAVIGLIEDIRTQIVSGILKEASGSDFGIRLYDHTDLQATFNAIIRHHIKYVISMSVNGDIRQRTAAFCRECSCKLVFIYEHGVGDFPAVNIENYSAAKMVVHHLAGLGHSRIAYICAEHRRKKFIAERHQGYIDGMLETGLATSPALIACREDRVVAINEMLNFPLEKRPTAFFCVADDYAMLAQRCILRRGLRIPEDISVFGFGNFEMSEFAVAAQSTVDNMFAKIGVTACKLVLGKECEAPLSDHGVHLVPTRLIIRESSGVVNQQK